MFTLSRILIFISAIILRPYDTSAFFLNWGVPEQNTPVPPQYYYHHRLLQTPSGYTFAGTEPQPIPAIPIQVPLQAQLSPTTSIHNVQLVPCLCPVSQELDYDKPQQENVYTTNNQHKNA